MKSRLKSKVGIHYERMKSLYSITYCQISNIQMFASILTLHLMYNGLPRWCKQIQCLLYFINGNCGKYIYIVYRVCQTFFHVNSIYNILHHNITMKIQNTHLCDYSLSSSAAINIFLKARELHSKWA